MKFLGYGVFSGVLWGSEEELWEFEKNTGIHKTRKASCVACDLRL